MIPELVVGALALAAVAYVLAPVTRGPRTGLVDTDSLEAEAEAKKKAAFEAIVDIETERDTGKLSEGDYTELRRDYELDALEAMRAADAARSPGNDDELEKEIGEIRARLACPSCGSLRGPGGSCPRCDA